MRSAKPDSLQEKSQETFKLNVKKRGRKPREKTYSIHSPSGNETPVSIQHDDGAENLVLHLPISSEDLHFDSDPFDVNDALKYNPVLNDPSPYSPEDICGMGFLVEPNGNDSPGNDQITKNLFAEFEDKKNNRIIRNAINEARLNEFMSESSETGMSICCWWCCHAFSELPIKLPIAYENNKFLGYGHFCSYNCACSYLFNAPEYQDKRWSIYSLLHLMYKQTNNDKVIKIRSAPPRQDLKMFGGSLSIEQFRKCNLKHDKEYKLLIPPMTMVMPQIEESKSRLEEDDGIIPVNRHKMHVATEALKRTKPILDHKQTLNSFMDIKKNYS